MGGDSNGGNAWGRVQRCYEGGVCKAQQTGRQKMSFDSVLSFRNQNIYVQVWEAPGVIRTLVVIFADGRLGSDIAGMAATQLRVRGRVPNAQSYAEPDRKSRPTPTAHLIRIGERQQRQG